MDQTYQELSYILMEKKTSSSQQHTEYASESGVLPESKESSYSEVQISIIDLSLVVGIL